MSYSSPARCFSSTSRTIALRPLPWTWAASSVLFSPQCSQRPFARAFSGLDTVCTRFLMRGIMKQSKSSIVPVKLAMLFILPFNGVTASGAACPPLVLLFQGAVA